MKAAEIMTTQIVTVGPDTPVREVAAVLLQHHISGVPVVDSAGSLLGMIGESDLIHRIATRGEQRQSWWQTLVMGSGSDPAEFIKVHGMRARDIMTRDVLTATEDTPVEEIAQKLEERRVRRLAVVRDSKLVGIVSRADLLRVLLAIGPEPQEPASADDNELRERVLAALERQDWAHARELNVAARAGVVQITGFAYSEDERDAVRVAVEEMSGVKQVENHLTIIPRIVQTGY